MSDRYCKPYCAGLDSETKAVEKRIGRLLEALAVQINSNIAQGAIVDDIRWFRLSLMDKLEKDGFEFTMPESGSRPKVTDLHAVKNAARILRRKYQDKVRTIVNERMWNSTAASHKAFWTKVLDTL